MAHRNLIRVYFRGWLQLGGNLAGIFFHMFHWDEFTVQRGFYWDKLLLDVSLPGFTRSHSHRWSHWLWTWRYLMVVSGLESVGRLREGINSIESWCKVFSSPFLSLQSNSSLLDHPYIIFTTTLPVSPGMDRKYFKCTVYLKIRTSLYVLLNGIQHICL